jgi:hypothetical protein
LPPVITAKNPVHAELNLSLAATVFVLICGFFQEAVLLAGLLVIPFVFWAFFQIVHAIFLVETRKRRLLHVGICFLAFVLIFGISGFRAREIRQRADVIVTKIQAYQEKHGTCPLTLEAIHESKENLSAALGRRSAYACEAGKPRLFYTAFPTFDTYHYDFERKTWDFVPD